jgi:hypothetical protein
MALPGLRHLSGQGRRLGGTDVTIDEVLTKYHQSITTELEGQVFTVTGTLEPTNRRPWGHKLYWYVVADRARLKVCIDQRDSHLSGRRVEVTGRLSRALRPWIGDLELLLTVIQMTALGPPTEEWMGPLRAIGARRRDQWPTIAQEASR